MNPLFKKILWYLGGAVTIGSGAAGAWKAVPIIAEAHTVVTKLPRAIEVIDSVHYYRNTDILQTRELVRQAKEIDSLKRKINVILEAKWPFDSLTILNRRNEWKTYHKDTDWLYRRN